MFVWTETKRAPSERDRTAREAMYHRELEERAALLLRLGRSPTFVKARLAANQAWDHGQDSKIVPADVEKIVDSVVRRQRTR